MIDPNVCKNCSYKWMIELNIGKFYCVANMVDALGDYIIINRLTDIYDNIDDFINTGKDNTFIYKDKKEYKIFHPYYINNELIQKCKLIKLIDSQKCPYYMEHKIYEWSES